MLLEAFKILIATGRSKMVVSLAGIAGIVLLEYLGKNSIEAFVAIVFIVGMFLFTRKWQETEESRVKS